MLSVERTVLVLLAAGRSERFGPADKLEHPFLGRALGLHVTVALEELPFQERVAIVGGSRLDYGRHGYRCIDNDDPALGMARSVALGVAHAEAEGAEAVLVALADMPRVTAAHVRRLFDTSGDENSVVASSDGQAPKPPALFGRGRFATLTALSGDAGARDLLRGGRHVITSPAELIDIDTPEELERLRAPGRSPEVIARLR